MIMIDPFSQKLLTDGMWKGYRMTDWLAPVKAQLIAIVYI